MPKEHAKGVDAHTKNKACRCLKVVIEGEVTTVLTLGIGGCDIIRRGDLLGAGHDTGLLVLANTLFEEVGLATEGDILHEVEGVGGAVHLLVAESDKESVSDELDVLLHQVGVHAQQSAGQSFGQEFLLDLDGIDDDIADDLLAGSVLQVGEEQASEVGVKTLVTRDQLVGEGQTRHEATLLQPEDGSESTAEEDTLNSSESYETLSIGRVTVLDPLDGPVGLLTDARDWSEVRLVLMKVMRQDVLVSIALKR